MRPIPQRPIMIQGAMQSEIDLYLKEMDLYKIEINGCVFYKGTYKDTPIIISKTKIGEIASAISTTVGIMAFSPRFIINQGTAGGMNESLNVGDIVIGKDVFYLSQFSTAMDKETDPLNPWKKDGYCSVDNETFNYKADETLLDSILNLACIKKENVHIGTICSGDVWTKDIKQIKENNARFGGLCEEMEAGALYFTANQFRTPAISIRVISNNEITGQPFDVTSSEKMQRLILDMVDEIIEIEKTKPFPHRYVSYDDYDDEREYIFCSVVFNEYGKSYYYLTDDETLEVGDYVTVKAWDKTKVVKIVDIEKYNECNAPYPVDETKSIISLVKKHNAPVSTAKPLFGYTLQEDNPNEDKSTDNLFDILSEYDHHKQDTLTETQISTFEKENNISLPVQYREMLLNEGNGFKIYYYRYHYLNQIFKCDLDNRVIHGIEWDKVIKNNRLSKPFLFCDKYQDWDSLPYPQFEDCLCNKFDDIIYCPMCDHKQDCIYSSVPSYGPMETPFYNGCLKLLDSCTCSYHLVLNGPHKGEVWFANEYDDFIPRFKSFKEFLEFVCTNEYV